MEEVEEKKKVLILGNGLSRIMYNDFIEEWENEIWGCNRVYLDWGHKLDRLTGHISVLEEADEYRKQNNLYYEIWGGNLGKFKCDKYFTCDKQFQKDSGTTLVVQAIEEGYRAYCLGFDLGGRDIYSPNHQLVNKTNWVLRWRVIANTYGLDDVEFIGHNHKHFILSGRHHGEYAYKYMRGKPHFDNEKYKELFEKFGLNKPADDKSYFVKVRFFENGEVRRYKKKVADIYVEKGVCEII